MAFWLGGQDGGVGSISSASISAQVEILHFPPFQSSNKSFHAHFTNVNEHFECHWEEDWSSDLGFV